MQISTGERSPNVYAPNGSVTVNLVDIRPVIRGLGQLGEAEAQRVAKLLKAGRYDEARTEIATWADRSGRTASLLAFLKYAQGLVALAAGRPVTAEREFAAAVALEPASCEYRGRLLMVLSALDRREEMSRRSDPDVPEVQACLRLSKPAEKARFIAARLVSAAETRQQPAAAEAASAFAVAIRASLAETGPMSWSTVVLTCEVDALAAAIWPDAAHPERQLLQRLCRETEISAGRGTVSAARLFAFGTELDKATSTAPDKGVSIITAQIAFIDKLGPIGELGFGEPERRLTVARLKTSRGFNRRWSPNPDLRAVAADYREAFDGLLPFLSPRHPAALMTFAHLVSYIRHFDEMHPELALRLPATREIERSIDQAAEGGYERWPSACQALARLRLHVVSAVPPIGEAHRLRLKAEVNRCAAGGVSRGSAADRELQRLVLQSDLQEAEQAQQMDEALSIADRLRALLEIDQGFPVFALPGHVAVQAAHSRAYALSSLGRPAEAREAWLAMAAQARAAGSPVNVQTALESHYSVLVLHFPQDKPAIVEAALALMQETQAVLDSGPPDCFDVAKALRHTGYAIASLLAADSSARALELAGRTEAVRARIAACGQASTASFKPEVLQRVRTVAAVLWFDIQKAREVIKPEPDGKAFGVDLAMLLKERDELLQKGLQLPDTDLPLLSELLRATGTLPVAAPR